MSLKTLRKLNVMFIKKNNYCLTIILFLFVTLIFANDAKAELADLFVWPVVKNSIIKVRPEENFDDPRVQQCTQDTQDKWYSYGNPFGNIYCPPELGCKGPDCYHPGEDWNRCDKKDAGVDVFSIANGTIVKVATVLASGKEDLGYYITVKYELGKSENVSDYILNNTQATGTFNVVYSSYLHLDKPELAEKDTVKKGQKIGTISSCCGHLHFEVKTEGTGCNNCGGCSYCTSLQGITDAHFLNPTKFIKAHQQDIAVSGGVNISSSPVIISQNFTINFSLKEMHGSEKTFEKIAVAILREDNSHLFDFTVYDNVTIAANGIWSQTATNYIRIDNPPGKYKAIIRGKIAGREWFDFGKVAEGINPRDFNATKEGGYTSQFMATALVLDRSGSMTGEKLEKAKEAAKAFAHTLNPLDQASVSLFSENASTVVEIGAVSNTLGTIDTAISGVTPGNSTNIGSGLEQALIQLEKAATEQGKRVALLMSDGLNNRGDWHPALTQFVTKKWRGYTVGFGKDADEVALRKIAESTGGTYWPADMVNLTNVYQIIGAQAQNKSVLLSTSESLAPNGNLAYSIPVTQGSQNLNVFTNWQGSKLRTILISPSGETISGDQLLKNGGRFSEGRTFQMFEIAKPQAGEWKLDISWAEPPPAPEQVNIAVSEKSDVFANLLGFRSEYKIGEPVIINVQAAEVIGDMDKTPLKNSAVNVQIQKPGPQMTQMVQAQSSNWTMYKEVMLDVTRSLTLSDDGAHGDYNAGDSIFGDSFTETDKNGAYLVNVIITGKKSNGDKIEKKLQGSFQVGPISQNPVTTSQVLQYMNQAKPHIDNQTPYSSEIMNQPKKNIEQMQGNPLDNINKILQKK